MKVIIEDIESKIEKIKRKLTRGDDYDRDINQSSFISDESVDISNNESYSKNSMSCSSET